jgi:hypothetical protein
MMQQTFRYVFITFFEPLEQLLDQSRVWLFCESTDTYSNTATMLNHVSDQAWLKVMMNLQSAS